LTWIEGFVYCLILSTIVTYVYDLNLLDFVSYFMTNIIACGLNIAIIVSVMVLKRQIENVKELVADSQTVIVHFCLFSV